MKFLIQRLALTLALILGTVGVSQAATLSYSSTISAEAPYLTTVNVTKAEKYFLNLQVEEGSPFYLLLNSSTAVSYSGANLNSNSLSAILDLEVGNHILYAFTTSILPTALSIELAPVPLPATLPLLAVALGAGGVVMRRRQNKKSARSSFPAAA